MDKLRYDLQVQTGKATIQLTAFNLELKKTQDDYFKMTKRVLDYMDKKPAP